MAKTALQTNRKETRTICGLMSWITYIVKRRCHDICAQNIPLKREKKSGYWFQINLSSPLNSWLKDLQMLSFKTATDGKVGGKYRQITYSEQSAMKRGWSDQIWWVCRHFNFVRSLSNLYSVKFCSRKTKLRKNIFNRNDSKHKCFSYIWQIILEKCPLN